MGRNMKWLVSMMPVLALGACAHKEMTPEKPVASTAPAAAAPSAAPSAERACSQDADCTSRQLCVSSRCMDITADLAECQNIRVHFDFDRADLRAQELLLLQRAGRCIMAEQGVHLTIEGNADERGTQEYNLALGDRRANAVEKYLERLGVARAQLKTVSYGKEQPLCTEHSEECWAKNRRAALK